MPEAAFADGEAPLDVDAAQTSAVDAQILNSSDASLELDCANIPQVLACTDFSGPLPKSASVPTQNGRTDMTRGYLDAATDGPDSWAKVVLPFPAMTSGSVFMRFRMFLPAGFAIDGLNFASLAAAGDPQPDFGVDFNLIGADRLEVFTTGDQHSYVATFSVPRDRWICFRAAVTIGNGTGHIRVTMDGSTVHDVYDTDSSPPGGIAQAQAGVDWASEIQGPAQVLVDDLVVASAPLGDCL